MGREQLWLEVGEPVEKLKQGMFNDAALTRQNPKAEPITSAPMPTQFSTGVDLHRRKCGTGTFSSISLR
jgi:hypothetical protein